MSRGFGAAERSILEYLDANPTDEPSIVELARFRHNLELWEEPTKAQRESLRRAAKKLEEAGRVVSHEWWGVARSYYRLGGWRMDPCPVGQRAWSVQVNRVNQYTWSGWYHDTVHPPIPNNQRVTEPDAGKLCPVRRSFMDGSTRHPNPELDFYTGTIGHTVAAERDQFIVLGRAGKERTWLVLSRPGFVRDDYTTWFWERYVSTQPTVIDIRKVPSK